MMYFGGWYWSGFKRTEALQSVITPGTGTQGHASDSPEYLRNHGQRTRKSVLQTKTIRTRRLSPRTKELTPSTPSKMVPRYRDNGRRMEAI